MKKKKNVIFALLLTGALVSNSFGNSISSYYDISNDSLYNNDDFMSFSSVSIISESSMVPQGLTTFNEYFLTSTYDFYKNNDSCVYTLDYTGDVVNCCNLSTKAHVGGISYDDSNDLLWITGYDGNVEAYKMDSVLKCDDIKPIYSSLNVSKGLYNYKNPFLKSASFLTYNNNHLFVGNFSLSNYGIVKEYEIVIDDKTKYLTLKYVRKFSIPNKVQGINFYMKDDKQYIIFSRSYGENKDSILQIFKYDDDIVDYRNPNLVSVSLVMPPMIEQSTIIDDSLYSVYESSSLPYKNACRDVTDNLTITDLDKLVKVLK